MIYRSIRDLISKKMLMFSLFVDLLNSKSIELLKGFVGFVERDKNLECSVCS